MSARMAVILENSKCGSSVLQWCVTAKLQMSILTFQRDKFFLERLGYTKLQPHLTTTYVMHLLYQFLFLNSMCDKIVSSKNSQQL